MSAKAGGEVGGAPAVARGAGTAKAGPLAGEGLLAALTLAPATWSRNRFFDLYKDPNVQNVRRRAGLLRGIVRHLAHATVRGLVEREEGDRFVLAYQVPDLGLSRTVVLTPFENAVLRVTLARARGQAPVDPWKAMVDDALSRLEPHPG